MTIGEFLGDVAAAQGLDELRGPCRVGLGLTTRFQQRVHLLGLTIAVAEGGGDGDGLLVLPKIAEYGLAGDGRVTPDAEQIVDRLKSQSEVVPEVSECGDALGGCSCEDGPPLRPAAREGPGLGAGQFQ